MTSRLWARTVGVVLALVACHGQDAADATDVVDSGEQSREPIQFMLGTLDGGTATRIPPGFTADQQRFSALKRLGTAKEIAGALLWVALDNTYLSGAVIPAAGGL